MCTRAIIGPRAGAEHAPEEYLTEMIVYNFTDPAVPVWPDTIAHEF